MALRSSLSTLGDGNSNVHVSTMGEFYRVANEVHDDLAKFRRVADYVIRDVTFENAIQFETLSVGWFTLQVADFVNEFDYVERNFLNLDF